MKIKSITLQKIEIPMVTTFTTGFGKISKKPSVLVKIETSDGLIGWGESAALSYPLYNPESCDTCMLVIKNHLGPAVLAKSPETIDDMNKVMSPVRQNYVAKTGLETAMWAIESVRKEKSISKMLGGTRNQVGVGESIGIKNSIEQTLDEITLRLSQGFQRIKVKIKPGWDIKLLKAIRRKFPQIPLMVDANSSYTLRDVKILRNLDAFDLTMIEQPLAEDDIIDHATLQNQIRTPICLDESILSAEDARKAIEIKACRIINIKPGRVGGLLESKKIHDICKKNNVGVWIGGMLELGIGRAFNVAAASLPNCIYPADISPTSFYYSDSIIDNSLDLDRDGFINVPINSGLGVKINEKKIKKYTTEKIIIK